MAETNYKDAIPTLKDEIEHATVESVLALDVDKYKYGFETSIESDRAPMGLNEDTVRFISAKKGEPEWMLEWRLDAYRRWLTMDEPNWARVHYPKIDFQDMLRLAGAELVQVPAAPYRNPNNYVRYSGRLAEAVTRPETRVDQSRSER